MEVRAVAKFVKVQPRKVRLVANEVRGKNAIQAANLLRFHPSKGAFVLHKVLVSAISNAEANHNLEAGSLKIAEIRVDEGPVLKRIQARAMGRANRIYKRMSHITVVVEDVEAVAVPKAHGTAAKPRPTLAVKTKGKKAAKAEAAPVAEVEEVKEEVVEEVAAETPAEEVVEETTEETTAEATEGTPAEEGEEQN
ncbi:MAG: 50S ribosomal protein L22 [Fimbriimonadaceae bacterium]|nr:50S ribosomal protein L22 [Fimbriimonadaceae bacterium]